MPDVRDSFSKVAANYSRSKFHTAAERMQEVLDLAQPQKGDLALDVATGTGNTAFALAPHVRRVIGLDITREMLDEAFRVLRPGRDAAFIDCSAPLPARELLHEVEIRRDPSHVLSLTLEEWVGHLERAGFEIDVAGGRELDWDYESWMSNQAVKPELVEELAKIIESAEGETRRQLHPERREGKLWHAYWHSLIRAHKPNGQ